MLIVNTQITDKRSSRTPAVLLILPSCRTDGAVGPVGAVGAVWQEGGVSSIQTVYVLKNLLLISSLLSLIIGTVVGLAQSRIKRLLAYSTISHIGFILLALAINSEQSIDSLIFYIIQYSITNLNTFLIILALGYILKSSIQNNKLKYSPLGQKGCIATERDIKFISELKGQFFSNPLLSFSLTVCLFSMAGKNSAC